MGGGAGGGGVSRRAQECRSLPALFQRDILLSPPGGGRQPTPRKYRMGRGRGRHKGSKNGPRRGRCRPPAGQGHRRWLWRPGSDPGRPPPVFFFFFTLVTGPTRSMSLDLIGKSMSLKYEPASDTGRGRLGVARKAGHMMPPSICMGVDFRETTFEILSRR